MLITASQKHVFMTIDGSTFNSIQKQSVQDISSKSSLHEACSVEICILFQINSLKFDFSLVFKNVEFSSW